MPLSGAATSVEGYKLVRHASTRFDASDPTVRR